MKVTNNENVHLSFAVWLSCDNYDYDSRSNAVSATKLIQPVRQTVLGARVAAAQQDTESDVSTYIPSSLGTAIHDAMEYSWKYGYKKAMKRLGYSKSMIDRIVINPEKPVDPNSTDIPIYLEQRSEKEIDGYIITGKYDAIMDGQIIDYKSTIAFKYMKLQENPTEAEEDYILQESIYRWLNQDKVTSDIGIIDFIFTDWSKLNSIIQAKKGYPPSRLVTHEIKLMSVKDTETWIKRRIAAIKQYVKAEESTIPLCTPKELWMGKSVFKYFKNQNKTVRATKNFDNYAEAQTRFIKDGSVGLVKEVKGEAKRCNYCGGYDLCTQKNQLIADGILKPVEG